MLASVNMRANMSKPAYRSLAALIYVVAHCALLVFWLMRLDGSYDNEDFLLFEFVLGAIGFPSTILVLAPLALMSSIVPIYSGHTYGGAVLIWLALASVGYVQWFVWIPRMVRGVRNRRRPRN